MNAKMERVARMKLFPTQSSVNGEEIFNAILKVYDGSSGSSLLSSDYFV